MIDWDEGEVSFEHLEKIVMGEIINDGGFFIGNRIDVGFFLCLSFLLPMAGKALLLSASYEDWV